MGPALEAAWPPNSAHLSPRENVPAHARSPLWEGVLRARQGKTISKALSEPLVRSSGEETHSREAGAFGGLPGQEEDLGRGPGPAAEPGPRHPDVSCPRWREPLTRAFAVNVSAVRP